MLDGLIVAIILLLGIVANIMQLLGPFGLDGWATYGLSLLAAGVYLVVRELASGATWGNLRPGRRTGLVLAALGILLIVIPLARSFVVGPTGSGQPPNDAAVGAAPAPWSFTDDFRVPAPWASGGRSSGYSSYTPDGLLLHPDRGRIHWLAAPEARTAAQMRIEATARLRSGQGGWGVFCRGNSSGEFYEFSVSHSGNAYIRTPGGDGTDPIAVPSFDAYQENTITAECRDVDGRVQLSLTIGDTIIRYTVRGRLLGPGQAGIHAFSFGDMGGDTAVAQFSRFEMAPA